MHTPEKIKAKNAAGSLHGEVLMGKPFALRLLRVAFECAVTAFLSSQASAIFSEAYAESCAWFPTASFLGDVGTCGQSELQATSLLYFLSICFLVSLMSTTFAAGHRFQQSALYTAGMLTLTSVDAFLLSIPFLQIALGNALLFVVIFLGYRTFFWLRNKRKTRASK